MPLNISSKELTNLIEDHGSSDESDRSLSNYHNFTMRDKVLKEILKNVSPQMLSNINEEMASK
jgi:hypothetical protein